MKEKLAEIKKEGKGEVKKVEVCREGKFNGASFTVDIFNKWVEKFKAQQKDGYKPPVHIGHNNDEKDDGTRPAVGLINNLYLEGKNLYADIEGLTETFLEDIKKYPYRSLEAVIAKGKEEFYSLALLGAVVPAVKNEPITLKDSKEKKEYFIKNEDTKEQDLTESQKSNYNDDKKRSKSIKSKKLEKMADKKEDKAVEKVVLKDNETAISKEELKELKEAKEKMVKLEEEKKTMKAESFMKENIQCSKENKEGVLNLVKKLSDKERSLLAIISKKAEIKSDELDKKELSDDTKKILSSEVMEGNSKEKLSEEQKIERYAEEKKLSFNEATDEMREKNII